MSQKFSLTPLTQEQSDAILEPHLIRLQKQAEYKRYQWQLLENVRRRDFKTSKGELFRPQQWQAHGLFMNPASAWLAETNGTMERLGGFRHLPK